LNPTLAAILAMLAALVMYSDAGMALGGVLLLVILLINARTDKKQP
jgi:hypothetical protein